MKFKVVVVHWLDAWKNKSSDSLEAWKKDHAPVPVCTAGLLVEKNKKGVSIGQTWWANGDKKMESVWFIPKGMIIKMTTLGTVEIK